MIRVNKQAIEVFRAQLKLERARLDLELTQAVQAWAIRIFRSLVEKSPQWSGNMAANWNFSVGFPNTAYSETSNKRGDATPDNDFWKGGHRKLWEGFHVRQLGHPEAIETSMRHMQGAVRGTWRDRIFITNYTPADDGTSYLVDAIEAGRVKLRPVNMVYVPVMLIDQTVLVESQRTTP